MSSFTKPLKVEISQKEYKGRTLAVILEEFEYHVGYLGSTDVIKVPAGFVTDFASVPLPARGFIPVFGRSAKAAVIHDYLVVEKKRSPKEAAKIFREAMKVLQVGWLTRELMYRVVLVYGMLGFANTDPLTVS